MRFFYADSTNIKIPSPCTLYICSVLKTKEEPRMNQGMTLELPNTKSAVY